jgi:hypothetical protein
MPGMNISAELEHVISDYAIALSYLFFARYFLFTIKNQVVRRFAGPILGGFLGALMGIGVISNSISSLFIVFPASLYLTFLPGRLEMSGK